MAVVSRGVCYPPAREVGVVCGVFVRQGGRVGVAAAAVAVRANRGLCFASGLVFTGWSLLQIAS